MTTSSRSSGGGIRGIQQIKAAVYFDSDMQDRGADPREQYSLDGDQQAMSAMRELATTPYFNPRNLPVASG